jgi:hypothetical protein
VLTPNGGVKDTVPPQVIKYIPDSAAINLKVKKISISFNEYIQLNDINANLVISPPVTKQPNVTLHKSKTVLVEFKEELKENTTYTISFGNAIADITEGNVKSDFKYVFSTGSYIDSLWLSGAVKYAHDLKPEKNVLVMLYSDFADSAAMKHLPDYFTKTRPDGSFKITNIKAGSYKLVALLDENNNYLYNPLAEFIAFADTVLKIENNATANLFLFKEAETKLYVKREITGYGSVSLVFSTPIFSEKTIGYNSTKVSNFITEYNAAKDTITYWFPDLTDDSIQFYLDVNGKRLDTISICGCSLKKKKVGKTNKVEITTNASATQLFDLNKNLILFFTHPIKNRNNDKILFAIDTLVANDYKAQTTLRKGVFVDNKNYFGSDSLSVNNIKTMPNVFPVGLENKKIAITILPGAFTDVFGYPNDTFKINFKTNEEKIYASLKIKPVLPTGNFVLQLLDDKGNVKQEFFNPKQGEVIAVNYLQPGSYTLRLIYDTDKNKKFSTGVFIKRQQPEKIIYYKEAIKLRSDWVTEIEWNVK